MDRDALWSMALYLEVVEQGSIAAAARAMHLTPSAVSKQLAKLEERFGVRLLQRTTRSLRMTTAGARLKVHAARLVSAFREAEADVQAESGVLRGLVRVSAPTLLGQQALAPIIAAFVGSHPEIQVELELSDRFVDLISERMDLALRVASSLPASGLLVRKLGVIDWILVASPGYARRHGLPRTAAELQVHDCLELSHAEDRGRWTLEGKGEPVIAKVRGPIVASSLMALYHCVLAGAGVGRFPGYLVHEDLAQGRLLRVLPETIASRRNVYALQPTRAHVTPRVRELASFVASRLPQVLAPSGKSPRVTPKQNRPGR